MIEKAEEESGMPVDKVKSGVFVGVIVLATLLFTLPALQALLASVR